MSEMIVQSAILQDGVIWVGRRHHNIIHDIVTAGGKKPVTGKQGFVDESGQFLTRQQAAKVALACGQIRALKYSSTKLFSEDLY